MSLDDDLEIDDKVVWTRPQDFASTKWNGFTIPVVMVDGAKVLDPEEITYENRDGLQKPIKIFIEEERIVNDMMRENPSIKIDLQESEEKIFARVVEELTYLWNGKYYPMKKGKPHLPSVRRMAKISGVSWNVVKRYLHVAKFAGLYSESGRGKSVRADKILTEIEKEAIAEFDDWKKTDPVQAWIEDSKTAKYNKNQKSLFNAMKIMDVSPQRLQTMSEQKDARKARKEIGDLMEMERYPDPRSEKNILPESAMLEDWQLPTQFKTGNKHTQGAWYWMQKYGLIGKPKVWYYVRKPQNKEDAKKIANMYKGKKWSLREWSFSPDAPNLEGYEQKTKYKDTKTNTKKSALIWHGVAKSLTEGAIKREEENTLYNFVGVIRQFVETFGLRIPDQDPESIWAQVANPARSATIHLKIEELELVKAKLLEGMDGKLVEFEDYYNYETAKEKLVNFKTVEESKKYWYDAYFYFLLSLELGFRAEEAFTIVGEELPTQTEEGDKSGKSGIIKFDNGDLMVQIYTRKGSKGKKGQKIHGGFILNEDTKKLIYERMDQIEKGMESKTPEKYGVIQTYRGNPYKENSLIGASGQYTKEGTLDLPTVEDKESGKEWVKPVESQRDKVRAMFRYVYHFAKLKDPYWYDHSLHSLRHVFAQYWLELTNYNFGFVARLGHWKTESIVRDVYGKSQNWRMVQDMKEYATKDPWEKLRQLKKERQEAPSQAEQTAIDSLGMGTETELEKEDDKLREKIYFEGGDYYDVRLPKNERVMTYYPVGTDIQYIDKKMKLPSTIEKLFKYDKKTEDGSNVEDIEAGK